ncbi:MAG: hypothetical protein LBS63_05080 [Prevotellaceae bacterium]|jgi:hypothetical protein|nr:hypothetical protein [Prevotellaceae bacterium]
MKQAISIDEIKKRYPNEWVLLGNPVVDKSRLDIFSGIPLYHSASKKEVCYQGKPFATGYDTIKMVYTGEFQPARVITSIFRTIEQ